VGAWPLDNLLLFFARAGGHSASAGARPTLPPLATGLLVPGCQRMAKVPNGVKHYRKSAPASVGGAGGPAPPEYNRPPPARGLARHNKRFTIEEIIKIVATTCQILRLKYAPNRLSAGAPPQTPPGEHTALPQTP